jgi:hypothetical protein
MANKRLSIDQRPGDVIVDELVSITAAAAGDAWEIHFDKPDGDIPQSHMVYVNNLCVESDFDVSIANEIEFNGVHAHGIIKTTHVENSNFTLLSKTAWNSCYKEKGAVLTDYSSEAESAAANDVVFDFTAVDHALYFGAPNRFRGLMRSAGTAGVYVASMVWEYWNGAAWIEFEDIQSATAAGAGDPSQPFTSAGAAVIKWTLPEDWVKLDPAGDPVEMYWCRCRVESFTSKTTTPLISRLYQMPAKYITAVGFQVDGMFNGNDAVVLLSNETQITLPTAIQVQIREL